MIGVISLINTISIVSILPYTDIVSTNEKEEKVLVQEEKGARFGN